MERWRLGARGEDVAACYLAALGWSVLGRNFRTARGEIDLVARDGDQTVFIEVRTWRTQAFGSPLEFIGRIKQERMREVGGEFLARCGGGTARFDVILVGPGAGGRLAVSEHLRDAF